MDQKAFTKVILVSFTARYSIHFRLVPHMINLAQLSIDHKVLTSYNFLWIEFWIGATHITDYFKGIMDLIFLYKH